MFHGIGVCSLNKPTLLFLICLFLCTGITQAQEAAPPELRIWLECIERGPYAGRAIANFSYSFGGGFAIQAEDSKLLGDTETGTTLSYPFSIQPGEHARFLRVNVGALKVVVWKVVFGGELYVVTAWDNPEVMDCPLNAEVTPSPTPEGGSA